MKLTLITSVALLMITSSFRADNATDSASKRVGLQVISALHKSSTLHYSILYPPMTAFHSLMDKNAKLYGSNLAEAKKAFEDEYQSKVIPALNRSFEEILNEGKALWDRLG